MPDEPDAATDGPGTAFEAVLPILPEVAIVIVDCETNGELLMLPHADDDTVINKLEDGDG
jgi:hypothetical protein